MIAVKGRYNGATIVFNSIQSIKNVMLLLIFQTILFL
jgi:hypothetical protein